MSDTVKVIGATHFRTVPSAGLLGHLFEPVNADGAILHVERDQSGGTKRVKGVSKAGVVNEMEFSGMWPNESVTFSTDSVPYLYAWVSLQQIPEFVVGWNFLFTFGYRSADAELVYEVVLPIGGVTGKTDIFPSVVSRSVGGKRDAAARAYYQYPTRTFIGPVAIDPNARIDSPYSVFALPSIGKPADLSPDVSFASELKKLSFFLAGPLPMPGITTLPFAFPGWDHVIWHMVAWCAGGAAAAGWAGCGAGALGSGLADLGDFAIDWIHSQLGGGGAKSSPPGSSGDPPATGGQLPKKKTDG